MVAWPHAISAVARLVPDTDPPPPGAEVSRGRTSALVVREALLRAARELLDERGPAGLAIRDIAARAGVAPMGVYNRFGSKDGILNALLEEGFAELAAAVTVRPDVADPLGAITTGMGNYRAFALANPAMYRLMFDLPIAGFEPSPEVRMMALAAFERLIDAVQVGIATGHLRPGDPEEIAQRVWAGCHGATSLELRGIAFITDYDTHYAALVRTLLRGLATHPDSESE
ncbi:TetR/AcrR family transcriptional regulator [Thermomonospora umbrina]|uniref:TetR/AcrR family transcriptional regulator n=1 Tax=Thermomonospora umbrina TaxID=111806 RepID=UPI0014778347|nr:TetR/AcrR family transcriptional regulator [Thermomonospora umbrina]